MSREYSKVTVTIENSKHKQTIEMFQITGSEIDVVYHAAEPNSMSAFATRIEPCIDELIFKFKPVKQERGDVYVSIMEEK